jgi:hypothetical protein
LLAPVVDEFISLEQNNKIFTVNSSIDCNNENIFSGTEIHVDNQLGNDTNPGTKDCPYRTVNYAISMANNDNTIEIHQGVYHENIFIQDFENLTIKSSEGERVVFDGTVSISDDLNSTWSLDYNDIYRSELGIDAWQLFIDYEEQIPARWPNANFSDFSVLNLTHNWGHGTIDSIGNYVNGELQDAGGVDGLSDGLNESGINPVGAIAILNVGSFKTYSRTVQTFNSSSSVFTYDEVPTWRDKHHNYFLEGKKELIDVPNEWWFDPVEKTIYMMFAEGIDPNKLDIRVKTQAYAFDISNSNNITIQDLDFFSTTYKILDCNGCEIRNTELMYPSTSKRGLGIAGETTDERWVTRMDRCTNCLVDNSSFAHTDGSAIEFHGSASKSYNNIINNSHFEFIDWSASDLPGLMVTVYFGGANNTFTNNTVHRTGASSTLSIGNSPKIFYNDISNTGYVQSDGAVVQLMMNEQSGSEIAYNWIHDTPKYGIRMDGPMGGTNTGRNATVHHNVLWNVKSGIMAKGDYHEIHNNTVFGSDLGFGKNQIIILHEDNVGNKNSSTAFNAADKISAHRSKSVSSNLVPGNYSSNFNGYSNAGLMVYDMLRDPLNYDFRPINNSLLDNLSAGAYDVYGSNQWNAGSSMLWQPMINPKLGCTNDNAINFNSSARINNHGCIFDSNNEDLNNNGISPDGHSILEKGGKLSIILSGLLVIILLSVKFMISISKNKK